jgi:hypothetical protein
VWSGRYISTLHIQRRTTMKTDEGLFFVSCFSGAVSRLFVRSVQLVNTEAVVAYSKHYPRISLDGVRKTKNILSEDNAPAEIRTKRLSNTRQDGYL